MNEHIPEPVPQEAAPAAGTASSAAGSAPAAAAKKPKRDKARPTRRVGTFTMGLTLILCGLLLCAWLLHPGDWVFSVLRFAPLVLVALGAELLIMNARFQGVRLKYDFLSILLSCILILVSLCGAAASAWASSILNEPGHYQQLRDALRESCSEALEREDVAGVDVYYSYSWPECSSQTLAEAKRSDRLSLAVELPGRYDDAAAFASDARDVIRALCEEGFAPGSLSIWARSAYTDQEYQICVDGLYAENLSLAELTARAENSIELPEEDEDPFREENSELTDAPPPTPAEEAD